jgi:cell division protease FtsH
VTYETEPAGFLGQVAGTQRLYSEETAREIDVAVREVVQAQFERARGILSRNRQLLEDSAKTLLARETLADVELADVLHKVRKEEPPVAAATALPA